MTQKETLIAKVIQDIKDKTATNSITPTILGNIIVDVVNAAMTPSLVPGAPTEIYTLDGKPVYKKLFLVPDGSQLSTVDLSIPEGTALLNTQMIKEKKPRVQFGVLASTNSFVQTGGVPTIVFKGALNEFKINGVDITSADIEMDFREQAGGTTTVTQPYVAGSDLIFNVPPLLRDAAYIETIRAVNIVGATPASFQNMKYQWSINGTPYIYDAALESGQSSGQTALLYSNPGGMAGTTPYQYTTEGFTITIKNQSIKIMEAYLGLGTTFSALGTSTFNLRLTFADTTTEDVSLINGAEVNLVKDFSTLADISSVQVEILGTSVILDGSNNTMNHSDILATSVNIDTTQVMDWEDINVVDFLSETLRGDLTQGFASSNVPTQLSNDATFKNIAITLEYIDLAFVPTP